MQCSVRRRNVVCSERVRGPGSAGWPPIIQPDPWGGLRGYWGTEWKYWHMHRHHFGTGTGTKGTGLCIVTIEPLWFADIGLRVVYQRCVPFHLCSVAYFPSRYAIFRPHSRYVPSNMFLLCCIIYWDYIWVPAIFRPSRVYGSALVVKIISLNSENVSEKCVNAFLEEI